MEPPETPKSSLNALFMQKGETLKKRLQASEENTSWVKLPLRYPKISTVFLILLSVVIMTLMLTTSETVNEESDFEDVKLISTKPIIE